MNEETLELKEKVTELEQEIMKVMRKMMEIEEAQTKLLQKKDAAVFFKPCHLRRVGGHKTVLPMESGLFQCFDCGLKDTLEKMVPPCTVK